MKSHLRQCASFENADRAFVPSRFLSSQSISSRSISPQSISSKRSILGGDGRYGLRLLASLTVALSFGVAVSAYGDDIANTIVVGSDFDNDFDNDGIPDHQDDDQDNDGILNVDEGYISYANILDYPAVTYVLLPQAVVATDEQSTGQIAGSVYRYPLLDSRGMPAVEFLGTLTETDTLVDWSIQQHMPKVRHQSAGKSIVHWQFVRTGSNDPEIVNVDLEISDLDGSRSESIAVRIEDIAGYSVSANTNLTIDDGTSGKLVFTAAGNSDNTENDAVTLHLRNTSELQLTYNSVPNVNTVAGLNNDAAGFRHSFDAAAMARYVAVPVVSHSDNDGYPDHRDLDSNNDGQPDVDTALDGNRDGMLDGAVDQAGVPSIVITEVVPAPQEPDEDMPVDIPAEMPVDMPVDIPLDKPQSLPVATHEISTVEIPAQTQASQTLNLVSDLDRDGIADKVEGLGDADQDGVPNQYDLDSDNDGIADVIEAGAVDADHNGIVDDTPDSLIKTYTTIVPDFDSDGVPDFLDLDSDQDRVFDLVEAGGIDADMDGVVDALVDRDGNGWDDRFLVTPLPLPDSDADGNPDTLDIDREPASSAMPVMQDDLAQTELDQPSLNDGLLVTGVSGGAGCTISANTKNIDPTLWLFLLSGFCGCLSRSVGNSPRKQIGRKKYGSS